MEIKTEVDRGLTQRREKMIWDNFGLWKIRGQLVPEELWYQMCFCTFEGQNGLRLRLHHYTCRCMNKTVIIIIY